MIVQQPSPTEEHIKVYRSICRLLTDDDLSEWQQDATWRLATYADDDRDPTTETSIINVSAELAAVLRERAWRQTRHLSRAPLDLGIPRDVIDMVKATNPILDEISNAIPLQRKGNVSVGRCPFHDDRTPSLVVWPERGRWKCFSCQVGGDVITWLSAMERLPFRDAVRHLAQRSGVSLHDPANAPRVITVQVA